MTTNTEQAVELKPCPFCESRRIKHEASNSIECLDCGGSAFILAFTSSDEDDSAEVIRRWNTRPSLSREAKKDRMAVALIIDPDAFGPTFPNRYKARQREALAKAAAINALPPAPSEGEAS